MITNFFSLFRRALFTLVFAAVACGLASGVCAVAAAENPANAFMDPYNGAGIKLPDGGGEPGIAYREYMNAAGRKDYRRLCTLMGAKSAELEQCLAQKQALDGFIALYSQTKSQKVLGGFMKGDEATLNVVFIPHSGSPGNGFVVMKKANTVWMISSTGGSGSTTVSAEASGTADLSRGLGAVNSGVGQLPEPEYTGPAYGKWTFTGDDDKGDTWTGILAIEKLDPDSYDAKKYQLHIMLEMKSSKSERRNIDTPCTWEPGNREVSCITELGDYRAVLSTDRTSLTRGAWNVKETEDWKNYKVVKTGGWTAAYTGGQGR